MRTLRKEYDKLHKLATHIEDTILGEIVRVCDKYQWVVNCYGVEFVSLKTGEEIPKSNPTVKRLLSLINEFERESGRVFDPQFCYDPIKWKKKGYIDEHMRLLNKLKRM